MQETKTDIELAAILRALSFIRAPQATSEYDLHALVREALSREGLSFRHEALLMPRRRIDILCGSIGVEIKRGKPAAAPLLRQLGRYAGCDAVRGLVLVAERPPRLPESVCGKPLKTVSLHRLWGIAL